MKFLKSEKEIMELLIKDPNLIEPSLELVRVFYKTKYGVIDIVCKDKIGTYVAIEVKKTADTNSPGQLAKYVFALKKYFKTPYVKGILVSPTIKTEVRELCAYFGLEFRELNDMEELWPVIEI